MPFVKVTKESWLCKVDDCGCKNYSCDLPKLKWFKLIAHKIEKSFYLAFFIIFLYSLTLESRSWETKQSHVQILRTFKYFVLIFLFFFFSFVFVDLYYKITEREKLKSKVLKLNMQDPCVNCFHSKDNHEKRETIEEKFYPSDHVPSYSNTNQSYYERDYYPREKCSCGQPVSYNGKCFECGKRRNLYFQQYGYY